MLAKFLCVKDISLYTRMVRFNENENIFYIEKYKYRIKDELMMKGILIQYD